MTTVEGRQPFHAHCNACGHEWVAFYLPVNLARLDDLQPRACPLCHVGGRHIFVGRTPADFTPQPPRIGGPLPGTVEP